MCSFPTPCRDQSPHGAVQARCGALQRLWGRLGAPSLGGAGCAVAEGRPCLALSEPAPSQPQPVELHSRGCGPKAIIPVERSHVNMAIKLPGWNSFPGRGAEQPGSGSTHTGRLQTSFRCCSSLYNPVLAEAEKPPSSGLLLSLGCPKNGTKVLPLWDSLAQSWMLCPPSSFPSFLPCTAPAESACTRKFRPDFQSNLE